jgi:hypothetical protein
MKGFDAATPWRDPADQAAVFHPRAIHPAG